jgi:hypothetical protein
VKLRLLAATTAALLVVGASATYADPISPGGSVSTTVSGVDSIYGIFGHSGDPGGENGGDPASSPAHLVTFTAGSGNVFTFSASGEIGCCTHSLDSAYTPDGANAGMNVTGANGLSSLMGNSAIPLVGVFTTDTDPNGGVAPATLTFNHDSPLSLSPLLDQVFYIGDGLTGYNNASGTPLTFTAPTGATRLYVGVIDAYGFNGVTGYYGDNPGSFAVTIDLAGVRKLPGVPEPSTWAMMLLGVFGLGSLMRARKPAIA